MPPPPNFFNQPPPQFGYFPNQPAHPPPQFHGPQGPRARGGGQSRGRGRSLPPQRQAPPQNRTNNQASNEAPQRAEPEKKSEEQGNEIGGLGTTQDKNLQVVCFNCGEIGHLSSACSKPRVCFICQSTNHAVDMCPEWKKPPVAAQYYGSANRGLGFFYIDVEPRGNRFTHWNGLDNFGLLKIEEGVIDEDGIILNLKELFDDKWPWQLRKSGEGKFIIRFPPGRRVENLVIGKTSLFYLNKGTVVASLSVWNGEIEPLGSLTEVWVQITGIPPKWVDWNTLREVSSGIGMMIEVDWHSLFNSFSLARVKLMCKNPTWIPQDRIFVFGSKLFRIYFKPEGFEQKDFVPDEGSDKGDDDIDPKEEDLLDDELMGNAKGKGAGPANLEASAKGSSRSVHPSDGVQGNTKTNAGGGTSVRRVLLFDEILQTEQAKELECVDLLKAMELDDKNGEDLNEEMMTVELPEEVEKNGEEAELVNLPDEWVYELQSQRDEEVLDEGRVLVSSAQKVQEMVEVTKPLAEDGSEFEAGDNARADSTQPTRERMQRKLNSMEVTRTKRWERSNSGAQCCL